MRLTDFDRGLGYGLLVAVACSVGAYWLGQDDAPGPPIVSIVVTPDGYDVRSITPMGEGESVDDAVDSIITEKNEAAGCEYNGQVWICADGLDWLADELNSPDANTGTTTGTVSADAVSVTDSITCLDTDGGLTCGAVEGR